MDLQGKTALVTGGARRVGEALSRALAAAGARVAVNYNASATEADALCKELPGSRAYQADVSRVEDLEKLVKQIETDFGRLDVVVNSASSFESGPFSDVTEETFDQVIGVNLKGPFFLAQKAAPLMKRNSGGCIVNIVDLSALQPWPSYAPHSVSKAGLAHLTKILARALGPEIRVNAIAPGTVLPPDNYDGTAGDGTSDRRVVKPTGTPDDVARAMMYLIESDFVTGQIVVVDGGRMLL
jgi:NAD(P)-dependent dehydrogenase (short-subunit alcohol dehydrogenase family)